MFVEPAQLYVPRTYFRTHNKLMVEATGSKIAAGFNRTGEFWNRRNKNKSMCSKVSERDA